MNLSYLNMLDSLPNEFIYSMMFLCVSIEQWEWRLMFLLLTRNLGLESDALYCVNSPFSSAIL